MFYWMKRSRGGSETLDSLDNMSKAEILRGIVTEKLATAAQEILAVVERTVAGYEEEASGFRQEIDRQRKQLELLQPRVKLDRRVKAPDSDVDSHEVVCVSEEEEDDQQCTQHQVVEDTGSLGLLWFDDDDDVCEDEEEQPTVRPATGSRQKREDLKDPDYQMPSRSFSPRGRSDRRRPSRPRISDTQNNLDLRIRILEDSQTDILSKNVFKKFPVQELQCPRGLQEADFLSLLRSTFPQLAADKPFDVFTSDRSRRLQPLKVKALTPEEICRTIRSSGAGNSALYIRLKTGEEPHTSCEDINPPQTQDDATKDPGSSFETVSGDETKTHTSVLSPRDQSERRKRGRPRLGEEPTHHYFKIFMLEDSQSDVVSKDVYSVKSSVQELKCVRGLQEADFQDLLRSTFPQLAGNNKPLEIFKADRGRRLQRLRVKTFTPAEIYRTMKSTGAGNSALYIRVKTGDEEDEELRLVQRNDESLSTDAMEVINEDARLDSSPALDADGNRVVVQSSSSMSQQKQHVDTEEADDAAESDVEDEAGDGDDDWKPDPELQLPTMMMRRRRRRRQGPKTFVLEKSKTPCKVCGVWYRMLGSLIKHAWSHVDEPQCVCGVCGEHFESVEELQGHLKNYQKTHDCSYCGKSFFTVTGLNSHTTLHTGNRPFRCDVCHKTFAHMSSLSVHRWVHVVDKPHKCDICPKAFGLKAQLKAHSKVHTGRDKYLCNVCGKAFYDIRSLTRHKATHSGERRYGCEICGKRFKILGTLKSHEKIHTVRDRPFLCDICCKTFVSNCGLMAHMKTHSKVRPFICIVCSKGFISNGELRAHMRVHTGEAPYGCSECGRFFKRKTHLNNHVRSHLGIKLFVCSVCGKACSRQEHLTVHMRTHNGERPYKCTVCDKAFTQGHCLKTHMKSHREEETPFLNQSTS
ncbi:zinc finger and SCAN domain-containing protein 2-like isoform X2 [Anabas testudineus]|uniref:zinc finger and SCAN domain-containing protein 2-like isoform X2 n=1 Tax=Anabas testudineus TaxID=64144 RepID=UPI000E461CCE|nr:zinc finger and SCAN domain-containing protein 2-like isoform X2 [Anabas testudineus]